jgi:mannose-1-phosphate guanylyltransferase
MTAIGSVLFAAGRGERLRPLTDVIPKPALPILDIPVGAGALKALLQVAPPVAVNVSHLGDLVESALRPFAPPGTLEIFAEPAVPYGTAGTLRELREHLGARVVTCNADVMTDLDPAALVATHDRLGAAATVAVRRVDNGADFVADGDAAGRFLDRRSESDRSGVAFIGMAVFETSALDLLPKSLPAGLGEALLRPLVERGEVALHVHDGYAADIGTPARFLRTSLDVLNERVKLPADPPGRVLDVGEGLAYLGPNARAERASLGAGAILLRGARLHARARVEHAIVWTGEEITVPDHVSGVVRAFGRNLQ